MSDWKGNGIRNAGSDIRFIGNYQKKEDVK